MKILEERILKDGEVRPGNVLKVDSFVNHQMDISLFQEMGKEWKRLFDGKKIDKILTIEASGIGIAAVAATYFGNVPVVFAKKTESVNIDGEIYRTYVASFTKEKIYNVFVSKKYINPGEHILIIDDFLAEGNAALGLMDLVNQGGAVVEGIGIAIEKAFQPGGKLLREKGIQVESLAKISKIDAETGEIVFEK